MRSIEPLQELNAHDEEVRGLLDMLEDFSLDNAAFYIPTARFIATLDDSAFHAVAMACRQSGNPAPGAAMPEQPNHQQQTYRETEEWTA